jgi:hypothetical protein
VKFGAPKKDMVTNFFSPHSFVADFGSEIRDLGWVKIRIRDPGINIPDPQHFERLNNSPCNLIE